MKRKILPILLLSAMIAPLSSCAFKIGNLIITIGKSDKLESVITDKSFYKVALEEKGKINISVKGDYYKCNITCSSSDTSVATIDNEGNITPRKYGSTVITITASTLVSKVSKEVEVLVADDVTEEKEMNSVELKYSYKDYIDHNVYRMSACPSVGNSKLLVVPVWFTDSDEYINESKKVTIRNDIEKAYFGSEEDTGWNSVSTYYQKDSGGKLNLQGIVTDWYETSFSTFDVSLDTMKTVELVKNVEAWEKSQMSEEEWASYDTDNDGYLDGLILIYGAPDFSVGNSLYENLWAYCYWLFTEPGTFSSPVANAFFWASYDFMYGDNKITNFHSGDTTHCKIDTHTYIHEMGHLLGLEDYYDYSGQFIPAGGFSMQDYNVGGHDPYSSLALGWANAKVVNKSGIYTLSSFSSGNHDIIVLPTSEVTNKFSPFNEYIILEYYDIESENDVNNFDVVNKYSGRYPNGTNEKGLRIWHVDSRLIKYRLISDEGEDDSYKAMYLTTDISKSYYYYHGFSNTYYDGDYSPYVDQYCSYGGIEFADYNLLQLIKNDENETYRPKSFFSEDSLFKTGSVFSLVKYQSQFVNKTTLNNGEKFPYVVEVGETTGDSIKVKIYKI